VIERFLVHGPDARALFKQALDQVAADEPAGPRDDNQIGVHDKDLRAPAGADSVPVGCKSVCSRGAVGMD
jgi:hypothetical protein